MTAIFICLGNGSLAIRLLRLPVSCIYLLLNDRHKSAKRKIPNVGKGEGRVFQLAHLTFLRRCIDYVSFSHLICLISLPSHTQEWNSV